MSISEHDSLVAIWIFGIKNTNLLILLLDVNVRLVGGATEYEGRLEVYRRRKWGTVCDYSMNDGLAAVICRSLGLPWWGLNLLKP